MIGRYKKNIFFLSLCFLVLVSALPTSAVAQTDTCVSANCHAVMGTDKFVHNPVKEGMCTTCHTAIAETGKKTKHPGNLTITLSQEGADLCYMCHEPKNKMKTVHAPVIGGDCTSCHNPHQSATKGMLKDPMPKLCFQCHPEDMMKHKTMHPPVAAGDCSSCHDNHQSDFPKRLLQDMTVICFTCHPDKEEGIKTSRTVHPPVTQTCTLCHHPHGSSSKAMLRDPVPSLCANCHPNAVSLAQKSVTKHGPMTDARSCMNCHNPHFSDQKRLLLAEQMELCLGCHNKEQATERGTILNMKAFLDINKDAHGPLKQRDCAACHSPHGSDYWRILKRYYPADLYTAYSDEVYAICVGCHSKAAFTEIKTRKATNFRDGDRNLHFLHVNKSVKGRTCRACHEVHASAGTPKHVKTAMEFSGWKMPINFTLDAKGGTCAPGCHGEKRYMR